MERHQRLPATGPQREALRQKGQFWTPEWVAQAMVTYVLQDGVNHLFDPAVGSGVFFRVAKAIGQQEDKSIILSGTEIDSQALSQALQAGLTSDDLARVQQCDFVLQPPNRQFHAIVA